MWAKDRFESPHHMVIDTGRPNRMREESPGQKMKKLQYLKTRTERKNLED